MKAIICTAYGTPEVLQIQEIPTPTPKDNEVLIRIVATAVNSGEVRIRKADPWAVKLMFGWNKPKNAILGVSLSGEIVQIWKDVTKFKVGDQVFGNTDMSFGAYAEYKCMSEDGALAIKPDNLTHTEAASIPFGATTALAFLRKWGVKSGDKVLIYGASGAVWSAAIQIAKSIGCHVTGVCSTSNVEMVKSLWADEVIDYTQVDFSENGIIYDHIMDSVGKMDFSKWAKSITETGSLILNSAMPWDMMKWLWLSMTTKKKVIMWGFTLTTELMDHLKWLIETNKFRPVIDRTYSLDQIQEAHAYVEKWHKSGNVVVEIS